MTARTGQGFGLSCGLPPGPDFADLAVLAEDLGYARVWIFDSAPLWQDPFTHLALAVVRTTRIGLGTAVLIPTQRSVMTMASGIATIARLSGGRRRAARVARRRNGGHRRQAGADAALRRHGGTPPDRRAAVVERDGAARQRA